MPSSPLDLLNVYPRHIVAGLLGQLRAPDPDAEAAVFLDPLAHPIVVGQEGIKRLVCYLVLQGVRGAILLGEVVAHHFHLPPGVNLFPSHFANPFP
jgi:hypothetical protein